MNQKQSKPNVILIVVDQMRADALSINRSDDLVVTTHQCQAVCQQEPRF